MGKMIEIEAPEDRAILVAAPLRGSPEDLAVGAHLAELERLADTAGARMVGDLVQRLNRVDPGSYLGVGKLEELKTLVADTGASLVIFNDELSPAQGKKVEAVTEVRVIDRSELILDIFATRARSNEARLQVELAQLEYLLPRLARMWVHLSRIRGGIGLRGPGETQLETDRRMIRTKIARLKKKLAKTAEHRARLRQNRRGLMTCALVGYTNAGKSSLLRAMTGAKAFVEDRLFATLDTQTRDAFIPPNLRVRLIDTVGFVRKLPHHLVASFRATLEESTGADVLLHVVDVTAEDWEDQVVVVDDVLASLAAGEQHTIMVFNKTDALTHPSDVDGLRQRYPGAAFVSARDGEVEELQRALLEASGHPVSEG